MELIVLIAFLILTTIALAVAAAVNYANHKSDERYIHSLVEDKKALKSENIELYARLHLKHGQPAVVRLDPPKPETPLRDKVLTPNVILRRQAEERADPDYINKAAEILNK